MRNFIKFTAGVAALSMAAAIPAHAASGGDAEKIRRLDIMLMVTGLRCRTTADNFMADYGHFTTNQMLILNRASDDMKAQFAASGGSSSAARALDRISVTMANAYGQGHPWLSCADLKMVAQNLAEVRGAATLAEAADQLLAPTGNPRIALARR